MTYTGIQQGLTKVSTQGRRKGEISPAQRIRMAPPTTHWYFAMLPDR